MAMKVVERELIIDIGGSSIGVCFVTHHNESHSEISNTVRVPFKIGSIDVRGGLQEIALFTLKQTLESIPRVDTIQKTHIVLADPWYQAETRAIVSESVKPLRISMATALHAIEKQREEAGTQKRTGRRMVESLITQLYVNGYPTTLSKTVHGTSLTTHVYESEADESFIAKTTTIIQDNFPHAPLSFHTRAFVMFAVLRNFRVEDSFVMLDIGAETSEVVIAHRDALRFTHSFPVGTLTLAREIANGGSLADALARLQLYTKGELSEDEMSSFNLKFEVMGKNWFSEYQKASDSAFKNIAVPQIAFLLSDQDSLQWLHRMMQQIAVPLLPTIIPLTTTFFQNMLSLGSNARYDVPLSFASLFSKSQDSTIDLHT